MDSGSLGHGWLPLTCCYGRTLATRYHRRRPDRRHPWQPDPDVRVAQKNTPDTDAGGLIGHAPLFDIHSLARLWGYGMGL